ncbi:DNA glycosylase AlkZ-like family protein [Solirubrobacter soli]|uniref:DNA glycosylase AlkZ-like family protein n=1 Tax=Solirubrobacter soli TaxID=363832 RepID=UPI001FE17508|nr:crosslink repair DNA glycosylase YcaQ family protein [Solirubrobacter soli]
MEVLRSWAVQDSPPGAAVAALVARGDVPVGWLDKALYEDRTVVAMYNPRTATAIVPADEAAAFGSAFLPPDTGAEDTLAVEAVSDALDGKTLSRDDLHEALRQRLPASMLPWCEGCQSHHARRGVLVMAGLHGKLCLAGRAGRQPAFARTDQLVGWDPPESNELVSRYKRQYGTSNATHFAEWAGIGKAHANALWNDDEAQGERLDGVRVIAPGDPLLLTRDREALIPDPTWRKRVWSAIPTTGVILQDHEPVALWKARKRGKTLEVTLTKGAPDVHDVLVRLASHRGCSGVEIHSEG